jgi:type IV secretory pathway TrbL component
MSVIPHEPSVDRYAWLRITEMWASLAIAVIWLAVLFDAIFGPNITSSTVGGTDSSVPSAVAVALFATIATWAVAKYGLRPGKHE